MQTSKLILGTALLGLFAAQASAQFTEARQTEQKMPPLISVTGDGEVRIDPDLATVRLGIQGQGKNAQEVQAQVNATMQKILAGVTKTGVDRKDIQTGTLSLFPIYSEVKPNQTIAPTIIAYRAQNSVTIRVLDIAKTGSVVDASIAGGANTIDGVDFGLRDDTAARQDAIKKAVKAAQAKAEAMAQALGVKLGGVYEASEANTNVMPVAYARAAMAAESAPVSPGQVGVSVSISLRYLIIQ